MPIAYRALLRDATDIRMLMPSITRAASDFVIVFVVLILLVGASAIMLSRVRSHCANACLLAGVSAQGLIVWVAFFCFCFESFTGAMCLHHGSRFEMLQFARSAWGVFPVTLLALLVPLTGGIGALLQSERKAEPTTEPYSK